MLDDASLLLAWERAYGKAPYEQALIMLATAQPGIAAEDLMDISIGRRDAALLGLRKQLFGNRMESLAVCPECNEPLELSFTVDDIMWHANSNGESTNQVEQDGFEIEYRLPSSRDLALAAGVGPSKRAEQLLSGCMVQVHRGEDRVEPASLPPAVRQQVAREIAESDPQADVNFDLDCVACGHQWNSPLDIVGFLWTELNAWCQRLLAEIHVLAKTYSWSESEILALSRWRRQVYLSMVRQ